MTEPDPKGSGFYFDVAELRIYAPNVGCELGIDQMIAALVDTERSAELARRTTNLVKWAARGFSTSSVSKVCSYRTKARSHASRSGPKNRPRRKCGADWTEKHQPGTMPLARISAASDKAMILGGNAKRLFKI